MFYDILVPDKKKSGWLSADSRQISKDVQTGDYLYLSKDEVYFLECTEVQVMGRVILTAGEIQLFCRPVKNYYMELMKKCSENL